MASIITLRPEFEAMLGFTQTEVDQLLDEVYRDYAIDPRTRPDVNATVKNHYNGYHFVDPAGEALYNSTILMCFLDHFTTYKEMPEYLTDLNRRADLSWVRRAQRAPASANAGDPELTLGQNAWSRMIPIHMSYFRASSSAQYVECDRILDEPQYAKAAAILGRAAHQQFSIDNC